MASTNGAMTTTNITPEMSFADTMAETRRRQRATVTGGDSTLDDGTDYTREFQTDDQKFMLWNLANRNLSVHAPYPAFRLLGLFPDQQSALAHAQTIASVDSSCDIRMATTHEWYSIPCRPIENMTEHTAKVNRNLLKHQEMLQDHASEFKERHDALTEGLTPAIEQAKEAQEQLEHETRQRERRLEYVRKAVEQNTEENVKQLTEQYADEMAAEAGARMAAFADDMQQTNKSLEHEVKQMIEDQHYEEDGVEESKGDDGAEESKGDDGAEESKGDDGAEESKSGYVEPQLVAPPRPEAMNEGWTELVDTLDVPDAATMPPAVSRIVEVRNQRYASISIVNDYETATPQNPTGDEPGIIVWAAFDTEEEAIKYHKAVASKHMRDHDLIVVAMYEWLYPHMKDSDNVEQLYRNQELDNLMRHSRTASKRVADFERQCKEEELDVPTMTIEPDLKEPAPRRYKPPVGSEL